MSRTKCAHDWRPRADGSAWCAKQGCVHRHTRGADCEVWRCNAAYACKTPTCPGPHRKHKPGVPDVCECSACNNGGRCRGAGGMRRGGRPITLPGRVRLEIQLSARHDAALRAMAADWGLPRAAAVRRLIEARKQWREAGA